MDAIECMWQAFNMTTGKYTPRPWDVSCPHQCLDVWMFGFLFFLSLNNLVNDVRNMSFRGDSLWRWQNDVAL
jgi:hypothetical protein